MKNIITTVGVLIFKDNNVLLVRNKESSQHQINSFGLPGGKIQIGETYLQGAIRELFEETGLISNEQNLVLLPTIYAQPIFQKDKLIDMTLQIYICTNYNGNLSSGEDTEPKWININDISKYNLLPNVDKIIKEGLQYV